MQGIKKLLHFPLIAAEPFIFLGFTLLNLLPVFLLTPFPTLDGPAHLYNSNLWHQLIFHPGESLVSTYFHINPEPVPNYLGNILTFCVRGIFPVAWCEKIIVTLLVVGFCYSFRTLITSLKNASKLASYLIFPFSFSFFLYLGFFNFLLSIIFLFFAIAFLQKLNGLFTRKAIFLLFIYTALIYFSHLVSFIFWLTWIATYVLLEDKPFVSFSIFIKKTFRRSAVFLAFLFPFLILTVIYFVRHKSSEPGIYLTWHESLEWLQTIRAIIAFDYGEIVHYAEIKNILFFLLIAGISWTVYRFIAKKEMQDEQHTINKNVYRWLALVVLTLIFYFTLPEYQGTNGYIVSRMCLYLFLFFIVFLSTLRIPNLFWLFAIILVTNSHIRASIKRYHKSEMLSKTAASCIAAAPYVKDNSVVYPLNFSTAFFTKHYSNYATTGGQRVNLENYEPGLGWFPLQWTLQKQDEQWLDLLAYPGSNRMEQIQTLQPDYVFVLKPLLQDSVYAQITTWLHQQGAEIYQDKNVSLFELERK